MKDRICSKVIEYGLLGLIIFSPLPAASVYEWSILVIQLATLIMMACYLLLRRKPQNNAFLSQFLEWPGYLFIGLFILVFIQIIPFPKFLVKIFSPQTYSFQSHYSLDFSKIKFMSLSLIPSHTFQEGLELLSYFFLGFLIVKTVTKRHQFMRIFWALAAVGIFEAFYGIFELYNKNPRILFYKKIYNLDSVTGTFVNRNHLSGYLEMVIPLAIGLIIARIDLFSMSGLRWRERLLRFSERGLATNLLLTFGVILMSLAIIFSKSRSGVFILIFVFILFLELTVLFFGMAESRKKGIKKFLQVVFLIITFMSLYVGINATLERFALDKLLQEGRPTYWANTLKIFAKYPLFGTGLGTFGDLYPDLPGGENPIKLVHAHNDFLEYLSEMGIIGFTLLMGGVLFMFIITFLIWRERKHPEIKGLALGGIIAIICILVHSITDFNLHIPANMLLFTVVLSLTIVLAFYKRGAIQKEKK